MITAYNYRAFLTNNSGPTTQAPQLTLNINVTAGTVTGSATLPILRNVGRYDFKLASRHMVLKSRGSPPPLVSLA